MRVVSGDTRLIQTKKPIYGQTLPSRIEITRMEDSGSEGRLKQEQKTYNHLGHFWIQIRLVSWLWLVFLHPFIHIPWPCNFHTLKWEESIIVLAVPQFQASMPGAHPPPFQSHHNERNCFHWPPLPHITPYYWIHQNGLYDSHAIFMYGNNLQIYCA